MQSPRKETNKQELTKQTLKKKKSKGLRFFSKLTGTRKTAQQLKALSVLVEDQGSVPDTHIEADNHL